MTSSTPSDEGDLSQVTSVDGLEDDEDEQGSDETDEPTKPETAEKRKKRLRIKALQRKRRAQAYELSGGSDCTGMVFMEITKLTDLPPERNGVIPSSVTPTKAYAEQSHVLLLIWTLSLLSPWVGKPSVQG